MTIEPGKHTLSEALEGQKAGGADPAEPRASGEPHPQDSEVAEQVRRAEEARGHGTPDRDEYLTRIGRGQQTHG